MAEYSYIPIQLVAENGNVLFNTRIGCNRGNVIHREDSGIFTLRGTNTQNARYRVTFNANIAVPTGETVGDISTALALQGEPLLNTNMIVTPARVDEYFNVSATTFITVPCGCCSTVTVKNTADIPINVQNANIIIERVA